MSHYPLTLVFDLDGTLVDTAPDLLRAANHVMATLGRPPGDPAKMRPAASHGGLAILRAAIGPDCAGWPEERLYPLFDQFLKHYEANIAVESQPYPGLIAALDRAEATGHILAVCTNKREHLARLLLGKLGLLERFRGIAGRDTFPVYKPDPRHLTGTIELAGGHRASAVMIGDSATDVMTAKAAKVPIVAVSFGYSDPHVSTFAPDQLIHHYDELDAALAHIGAAASELPVPYDS